MNLILFREQTNGSTENLVVTYFYYDALVKSNPVWFEISVDPGMYYASGKYYNPDTQKEQDKPYEKPINETPNPNPNPDNDQDKKTVKKVVVKNDDKTKTGFCSGIFTKTSLTETALGLPKNVIWIGLVVLVAIIGFIIRNYQKNALQVNEMTQSYANSI